MTKEIKFNKVNELLKNTTDHSINNVSKLMLESGFTINDTFVAVCGENETYIGIYPNQSLAELEVSTLGCKCYIEGTKRLLKDEDFCDEYYWEIKY